MNTDKEAPHYAFFSIPLLLTLALSPYSPQRFNTNVLNVFLFLPPDALTKHLPTEHKQRTQTTAFASCVS
jgi:hypothetical protein